MLSPDMPKPLYEQLREILRDDIINGKYSEGGKMPSEDKLREIYGVSRITVRRAIQDLCNDGMLQRQHGKGTFVLTKKHKDRMDIIHGFTDYMEEHGREIGRIILEKNYTFPSERVAESLNIGIEDSVIYLKRLMLDQGFPFMLDECWYPATRYPNLFDEIKEDSSTYHILSQKYKVKLSKSYKEINAILSTEEISSYLACSVGDPIFSIYKVVYDTKNTPVQVSKMSVLGNRVTYTMTTSETESVMSKNIIEDI